MKDEFSKELYENDSSVAETKEFKEIDSYKEIDEAEELKVIQENSYSKKVKSKTNQSSLLSRISTFFVGLVAAGALVVSSAASSKVGVKFDDVIVTDTTITYGVTIDSEDEVELYLVLSNDFVNRRAELTEEYTTDTFTDLQPNMEYKLEVVTSGSFGEKVIVGMKVKTLSEDDYRIAEFSGVTGLCECHVDGYYHFTMNFVDNINAYANFEAYLEDEEGNVSYCQFNDDYHSEQTILVIDSGLSGESATLVIKCDVTIKGNTQRTIIYQSNVAI